MLQPQDDRRDQAASELVAERRAWVRYPSTLTAPYRRCGSTEDFGRAGKVLNISVGGIGLVLRCRYRPGTILMVDLKDRTGTVLRTVEVRVIHATAVRDDAAACWLLGCAFTQPLTEAELQVLIAQDQPPVEE